MNAATTQIDGDPLAPASAVVDLPRVRDALGVTAPTDGDTSRHMEITIVVIVEQTVFDERRHDLVECTAAKTKNQQRAVFAVSQGYGIAAAARARGAPVVTLARRSELAADAGGVHRHRPKGISSSKGDGSSGFVPGRLAL